jgi:hypothetical protein
VSRRTLQPLAVLLVGLVILGVLAFAVVGSPGDDVNPSSRSAGKHGTLALYTWLTRLGLPVSRISGQYDVSQSDVLIEYDPTVEFSAAELDVTTSYLRGGGDMVLVLDASSLMTAQALLSRLGVELATTEPSGYAVPAQPYDPGDRVHRVPVGPGFAFLEQPPLVPLLRENGAAVLAAVRAGGGGRAYVVGDAQPLSNDGLRNDDSASLVLSLLTRARGGRVAFDEYHHGEGAVQTGPGAVLNGPIGVAAVLAALIVLAALAVNGRRLGRPVGVGDEAPIPSASGYIAAMGDLFARSRRRGAIAARYSDELKRRAARITGVAVQPDDEAFIAAVTSAGDPQAAALGSLLRRAGTLAGGDPDEAALLQLARDIDAFERAWVGTAQWRP